MENCLLGHDDVVVVAGLLEELAVGLLESGKRPRRDHGRLEPEELGIVVKGEVCSPRDCHFGGIGAK